MGVISCTQKALKDLHVLGEVGKIAYSIEEQFRRNLHAHFAIWLKTIEGESAASRTQREHDEWVKNIYACIEDVARDFGQECADEYERVMMHRCSKKCKRCNCKANKNGGCDKRDENGKPDPCQCKGGFPFDLCDHAKMVNGQFMPVRKSEKDRWMESTCPALFKFLQFSHLSVRAVS